MSSARSQMTDPSVSNFKAIFDTASDEYKNLTGRDLKTHPFATDFDSCNTPDAVLNVFRKQAQGSDKLSKGNERLLKHLSPIVHILFTFSAALGAGIGLPFSPAMTIFTGIGVLLGAARDVAASYDTLVGLFERIQFFLQRLNHYTDVPLMIDMVELLGKVMAHVLSVLALSTKEMKEGRIKNFLKRLRGRKDVEDALQRLDRLTKEEISMIVAKIFKVTHDANATMNQRKRCQLREELRRWLDPPDPSINHKAARGNRLDGTARWFIQGRKYKEWKEKSSLLWISGNPGSGKTILCSTVIEDVKQAQGAMPLIAYYYFDSMDTAKRDIRGLLSSLIFQIADNSERCWDVLYALYTVCREGFEPPSETELAQYLKNMLELPGQVPIYLLIDALDECPHTTGTPSAREKVLNILGDVIRSNHSNLFICITSRPEQDIQKALNSFTLPLLCVSLHEEAGQREDINSYIRCIIHADTEMGSWTAEDKELVFNTLSERAGGMFRWVYCQLDTLRRCMPSSIRKILDELPNTLDETYERALQGIPKEKRQYAHRLFQCLIAAIRPLCVEELAEVFAIEFEPDAAPGLVEGWRPINPEEAVLSACSTLITITEDKGSSVVQFSHFSVKEFLTSARLRVSQVGDVHYYYIPLDAAHAILARACLTVLLQLDKYIDKQRLAKFPLAFYAAQNWVKHAKSEGVSLQIQDVMERLFNPNDPFLAAWVWIHDIDMDQVRESPGALTDHPTSPEATVLYYATLCGFSELVDYLIMTHAEDVNAKCGSRGTALHAASYEGHLKAVHVLLDHGADLNTKNGHRKTPLYAAYDGRHLEVMRLLLEHGADPNVSYDSNEHLLHRVSGLGEVEVGRLLLQYKADANARDNTDWTPLHWASINGYPKVVALLLESQANVNALSTIQATPLHSASRNGHPMVVRLLLKNGANVNALSEAQLTPLHLASRNGHVEVVKLLLESKATADALSMVGTTPLHLASREGHSKVVELLLEIPADVNVLSADQATPLHLASRNGHFEIQRLLLEHGADMHKRGANVRMPSQIPSSSQVPMLPWLPQLVRHTPQEQFDLGNEHHRLGQIPAPQPFSRCTGVRRALIIGINYASHPDPGFRLSYCVESAHSMANFLCASLRFEHDNVRIMTDRNPQDLPTKENILNAMRALVYGAQPHDSLFFYFSGHAGQIKDTNGDEADGLDECLCAVDYRGVDQFPNPETPGLIIEDIVHEIMVKPLPLQCRLTAIFDCPHSGTILDLSYLYSSDGMPRGFPHRYGLNVHRYPSCADIVSFCVRNHTRMTLGPGQGGALRQAFVDCMNTFQNDVTYKEFIKALHNYTRRHEFLQEPLLSSSHLIDTNSRFII